jgi:hybrid cluster-associated redox disulfide protein
MEASRVTATMTVDQVMSKWPATIAVFRRHQMACVGCPVAPFTTLAEAAVIYGISLSQFLTELSTVVAANGSSELDATS